MPFLLFLLANPSAEPRPNPSTVADNPLIMKRKSICLVPKSLPDICSFRWLSVSYLPRATILCFVPHNYHVCRAPPRVTFGFYASSIPAPCPSEIPRIIFFYRLNFLEINKVVCEPPSTSVISHKNPAPAVLEYAHPEACKADFQLIRGIFHSTDKLVYFCDRIFIKAAAAKNSDGSARTSDTDNECQLT